jgi:hypothetical protein
VAAIQHIANRTASPIINHNRRPKNSGMTLASGLLFKKMLPIPAAASILFSERAKTAMRPDRMTGENYI